MRAQLEQTKIKYKALKKSYECITFFSSLSHQPSLLLAPDIEADISDVKAVNELRANFQSQLKTMSDAKLDAEKQMIETKAKLDLAEGKTAS